MEVMNRCSDSGRVKCVHRDVVAGWFVPAFCVLPDESVYFEVPIFVLTIANRPHNPGGGYVTAKLGMSVRGFQFQQRSLT